MEETIKTIIPADSWSAVYAEDGEIWISPLICFALIYTVDENGGCSDYVVGLDSDGRAIDSATEISNFIGYLKDADKNQKRAYELEAKELGKKQGKTASGFTS